MSEKYGNVTSQACAACKHQRRKCHKNCPLAPYFPASQSQDFLNVQRLFGVSNIVKILNQVEPDQRGNAMKSILMEARARKEDPVEGIVGTIRSLSSQIENCQKELAIVYQQILYCRQREQMRQQQFQQFLASSSSLSHLPLSQQFDGGHYQMSDLPNEAYTIGDMNFQEYEDIKNLDVKPTIGLVDGYQHKKPIINFKDAEKSSAESVPSEKWTVDRRVREEPKSADRVVSLNNLTNKKAKQSEDY